MDTSLVNGSRLFGEIEDILITDIKMPSNNLRISNDLNIEKIANSIRQHGLLHPIVVKPNLEHFEIVAGVRRYLACKSLHWKKIPCHIVNLNEMQTFEIALVENIRRKSFTPLEEANAFKIYVADHGWGSIAELSRKIGKSPSAINRRIGLLDLSPDVLENIRKEKMHPSTAEELIPIRNLEKQSLLAEMISRRRLTTKHVRRLVRQEISSNKQEENNIRNQLIAFDKSIVALRIASNRIVSIMNEENENNFLTRELLLHQRNVLHNQIDILIKTKRKYRKKILQQYQNRSNPDI
ncbi:MAG: ParB/RepB/Spo0J family partition protein [Candidatus Nitrosocosmicus sp.]